MAQKWEYKVVTQEAKAKKFLKRNGSETATETLNELGQEGWELVDTVPLSATQGLDLAGTTSAFVFVLKRKKQ